MPRIQFALSPRIFPRIFAGVLLALAAVACRDPNQFQANLPTATGRFTVHDINASALASPNAIAMVDLPQAVRANPEYSFDLAISFDTDGTARLYGVHLVANEIVLPGNRSVGIQKLTEAYSDIVVAPNRGYEYEQPVPIALGDVGVVEALNHPICAFSFGFPNIYAKFEVEAVDAAARTVRMRMLSNANCGFRSLEPGLPTR